MIRKYVEIFCRKNVSSFCSAKATHIFSAKNFRKLYIESLCWGLTTRQPLWVILCRLPEREKSDRRDSRRDEREEQGRKRNRNESEETEEIKTFPLKDSRPCPTVSQYQLDAPVTNS